MPSLGYGNCRHFCPYLRPRCVWLFAVHARMYDRRHARTHARTHALTHVRAHGMHVCTYAFADWPPPRLPASFTCVVRAAVLRDSLISENFVKRARINRAGTLLPSLLHPLGTFRSNRGARSRISEIILGPWMQRKIQTRARQGKFPNIFFTSFRRTTYSSAGIYKCTCKLDQLEKCRRIYSHVNKI